jgi:carbon monoxide dehydrogenase subunit G
MDMTGEERIAAPRNAVWEALNDPSILMQCIPSCQSLEWISSSELVASIKVKVGPISASFSGTITLSNVNAPESYTLEAEGKGGLAGFARGAADVVLEEDGGVTLLQYQARAELGGKIAKLGSKLVRSSTAKLARQFFSDFNAAVSAERPVADERCLP